MRLTTTLPVALLTLSLAGCAPSIADLNARPDKYYTRQVKVVGRIERTQFLPHATLLEVSDAHGRRLIVRAAEPVEAETGDWVKIQGAFVPEVNVEDATLYDVLSAERVERTRPPRFQNLF